MTWIQFTMWLVGLYSVYYAGNFLFDISRAGKVQGAGNTGVHQLTFAEDIQPQTLNTDDRSHFDAESEPNSESNVGYLLDEMEFVTHEIEDDTPLTVSPIAGIGGVSMKEAMELARNKSIEYTHKVAY